MADHHQIHQGVHSLHHCGGDNGNRVLNQLTPDMARVIRPLPRRRASAAGTGRGAKGFFLLGILFACLSTLAEMLRPKVIEFTVDGILGDQSFVLPGPLQLWVDRLGGAAALLNMLCVSALHFTLIVQHRTVVCNARDGS